MGANKMNSKTQSGLQITASVSVPEKSAQSFAPIIIKFLLVLFGAAGSVFCFLSCVDLPTGFAAPVLTAVIVCAVFTFTLSLKQGLSGRVSVCTAAAFLAAVYLLRQDICAGFANTANVYLAQSRERFFLEPFIFITEPELAERHVTVFICFYTALLCMTMTYFASRSETSMMMCMPMLLLPIAVLMFGFEPNYIAFASVVAICAAAFAMETSASDEVSAKQCRYASSFSGLFSAAAAALCFAVAAAAVQLGGYERSARIDDIYESFTDYVKSGDMASAINDIASAVKIPGQSGAINHGKLGEFDEISFDNKTVLRVTIPKSDETVYLHGFVGSVYTGKSWEELPSAKLAELESITEAFSIDGLSPMLLDSYNLKLTRSNMTQNSFAVKNISANKDCLYVPYNLVPESVSEYTVQNGSFFRGGESICAGQFYDPSECYGYRNLFVQRWSIPAAMYSDEAAYRSFVYENYLEIPDGFSAANDVFNENYYEYISAEDSQTGKSTLDEMTVFSRKLYYIKQWLRSTCTYSLSAGKLPAGEDFVEHFLDERRGSCSHFASTAALMCRYAGIPARYVEGYIIKPGDFPSSARTGASVTVDVSDARGHAWVEIYIDGFGWYPMEFTSGYGNVRTAIPAETSSVQAEEDPEISEESVQAEETTVVRQNGETSPLPQENPVVTTAAAVGGAASETSVPNAPDSSENKDESADGSETESVGELSYGFGIFGIKGDIKVDRYYDLTRPFLAAGFMLLVPIAFIIRRKAAVSIYKRKCSEGSRSAAFAAYRRFDTVIRLMKLPQQGGLDYTEYAEMLSERSELLSDGTAFAVIETALKASFGGEYLTDEEAQKAVLAVKKFSERYFGTLSRFDKLAAKYIYCLV